MQKIMSFNSMLTGFGSDTLRVKFLMLVSSKEDQYKIILKIRHVYCRIGSKSVNLRKKAGVKFSDLFL